MSESPVLSMKGITKEFYGSRVLHAVDLELRAGEVHALLGENGAGKSTLMNILFGMPVIHETGGFEGTVEVGGAPVGVASPAAAMELGIGMVHQEFMLIPGFAIYENIKLNRERLRGTWVSRVLGRSLDSLDVPRMRADARAALDRVDLDVSEDTLVGTLPVGHMQFVEIAREVDKEGLRLLVFDEPTAVLAESEAERLLDVMRSLAGEGVAVLFITHRLDEVMRAADTVTILRDGRVVSSTPRERTSLEQIAERMVGREVAGVEAAESGSGPGASDPLLTLADFYVSMPGEEVRGIDLEVRRGEILGIGGLAGQGKIGIANGLMGRVGDCIAAP